MKKVIIAVALFAFSATVTFAQTTPATTAVKTEKEAKPKKTEKSKAAKTSDVTMYQCPMKCETARDYGGKCPKCLMDLVAINPPPKKKPQDGHTGHSH